MEKKYIKPQARIIKTEPQTILAGSGNDYPATAGLGYGGDGKGLETD